MENRVVVLLDMDCFYVQVEQKLNPSLQGEPCAVVQYKPWKGGSIIAVNYEARAKGVTRSMFGDEAKQTCPEIKLARVREVRGKADLTPYRDASVDVFDVLTTFSDNVEKASIDEAFIDLTEQVQERLKNSYNITPEDLTTTHVVGWDKSELEVPAEQIRASGVKAWLDGIYCDEVPQSAAEKLAIAGVIVEEIRAAVLQRTSFHCSAGISHNKMLSKLACGLHKPKSQTILPHTSVPGLFADLSLKKIRNLGGKLGDILVDELQCQTMADLSKLKLSQLQKHFGEKTGLWLYDMGRGIENEAVVPRRLPKSIGCSKNFRGKSALATKDDVKHWLQQMSEEVDERLKQDLMANKRMAKVLTVSVHLDGKPESVSLSRSCPIVIYEAKKFAQDALTLLQKLNKSPANQAAWNPPILSLGLSASKFQDQLSGNFASMESFIRKRSSPTEVCSSSSALQAGIETHSDSPSMEEAKPNLMNPECLISKGSAMMTVLQDDFGIKSDEQSHTGVCESKEQNPSACPEVNKDVNKDIEEKPKLKKGFFASILRNQKMAEARKMGNLELLPGLSEDGCKKSSNTPSDGADTLLDDLFALSKYKDHSTIVEKQGSSKSSTNSGITRYFDVETKSNVSCASKGLNKIDQEALPVQVGEISSSPDSNCASSLALTQICADIVDDLIICGECGITVSPWDLPVHLDFHFATRLQQEVNNSLPQDASTSGSNVKQLKGSKAVKRKKGKASSAKNTNSAPDKKLRTIDCFFKK